MLIHDIKRIVQNKRLWAVLLVCLAAVWLLARGMREDTAEAVPEKERVAIGIINHDTSIYSKMITSMYLENGLFTSYVSIELGEADVVYKRFADGELDMYVEIPEDFAVSMESLEHLPVQVVISTRNTAIELMLKNLMESYAGFINAVEVNCVSLYDVMRDSGMSREAARKTNEKISILLIMQALSRNDFFKETVTEHASFVKLVPFYLHEAVFLLMGFMALLCGLRFQKEHHSGIVRRLNAVGKDSFLILSEKLLLLESVMVLLLLAFKAGMSVRGVDIPVSVVVVMCAAGGFLGAIMLTFAACVQKMQNYLLISNMFLLLGAVLGGGIIPYMYLSENMERVAKCLPNYWFLKAVFAAHAGELPEYPEMLLLLIFAATAGLLGAAAWVYSRRGGRVYENA